MEQTGQEQRQVLQQLIPGFSSENLVDELEAIHVQGNEIKQRVRLCRQPLSDFLIESGTAVQRCQLVPFQQGNGIVGTRISCRAVFS